jgi:hypothetical protein
MAMTKESLASTFGHGNEDKARVGERHWGSGSNDGRQRQVHVHMSW